MGALFPRWSNTAIRVSLLGVALAGTGVLAGLMVYMRTPYAQRQLYAVDQPVEFDHRHHVLDDEIDCRYCHSTVDRAATAGFPSTAVCMGCHVQVWNESPMLEPVRRAAFSGFPLRWNRVHQLPDFVYFDHSMHVRRDIDCSVCHGDVERMGRVYQVAPMNMAWCLACHRTAEQHGVTEEKRRLTDCSTCHR